jgi:hypothetical protein
MTATESADRSVTGLSFLDGTENRVLNKVLTWHGFLIEAMVIGARSRISEVLEFLLPRGRSQWEDKDHCLPD